MKSPGTLYVVATPIGNLEDLSSRAVSILQSVDLVATEDTRSAAILFERYGINTPTRSYYDHNERSVTPDLVQQLSDGIDVALISEAGTPGVSDPGFQLVRQVRTDGIPVIAVPGPCAAVAALSASGLPSDRFYFIGFAPKGRALKQALEEVALMESTIILYESPRRIKKTLTALGEVLGRRVVSIAREMTKIYEEHLLGTPDTLLSHFTQHSESLRGEFTMIIAPPGFKLEGVQPGIDTDTQAAPIQRVCLDQVDLLLEAGYRLSDACRIVARGHEIPRSPLYRQYIKDRGR